MQISSSIPRLTLIVALLGLVSPACSISPPPIAVASETGTVRAYEAGSGAALAESMDRLVPEIRAMIPGTKNVPADIWLQRDLRMSRFHSVPDSVNGLTVGNDRILLRESDERLHETLCHELVHHLLDDSWETLPTVIEEGLCERVSEELASDDPVAFRSRRLATALHGSGKLGGSISIQFAPDDGLQFVASIPFQTESSSEGGMKIIDSLSLRGGYSEISAGNINATHYAIGYWIVDRIVRTDDYRALHRLTQRASSEGLRSVPPGWLLAAAGLSSNEQSWYALILEGFGEREVTEFARTVATQLAISVARYLHRSLRATVRLPPDLGGLDLRLRLAGRHHTIDLLSIDTFRARLARHLASLGRIQGRNPDMLDP